MDETPSPNSWEAKQAARRDRYLDRAAKADGKAQAADAGARRISDMIPLGQPILVGHHSEARHRRDLDRIRRGHQKASEAREKAGHYRAKAAGVGLGGISSDDPEAVSKLERELADLQAQQDLMKAANRAHEAFLKDPKSLDSAPIPEAMKQAVRTYVPEYSWEPHPFAPFQLRNNVANIRRIAKRIVELQAKAGDVTRECVVAGVRVVDSVEDNRLQLFFPGEPPEEVRKKLKARGFRWSPTANAWQAFRSSRAIWAAGDILGAPVRFPEMSTPQAAESACILSAGADPSDCSTPDDPPYWEMEEGWDDAGNCLTCGEAGRCECLHPALSSPRPATCRHSSPCGVQDAPATEP